MEEQLNYNYWQQRWRELPPASKKRWRITLAVLLALWLAGTYYAYTHIGGIATMSLGSRLFAAVVVGPWGLVWGLLALTGAITENVDAPGRGWLLPFFVQMGLLYLLGKIAFSPPNRAVQQQRQVAEQEKSQGRLPEATIAPQLRLTQGVPLVTVKDKQHKLVTIGMEYATGQGHILVISPTRGGKGLQLTEVLRHWPGAAVVVDPKAEQYARTAGWRQRHIGPIYHVPGHQVHLAGYYNFQDADDVQELHDHLLQPDRDRERIFADKSLSLMISTFR